MQLHRIDSPAVAISCPHCAASVAALTATGIQARGDNAWLSDGDMVPGVREAIGADELELSSEAFLSVGNCPDCAGGYWVAEAILADATQDQLLEYLATGELQAGAHCEPQSVYVGTREDVPHWWLTEERTAAGLVHTHTFGPFAIGAGEQLQGASGVAACGTLATLRPWTLARELLVAAWPELARLHYRAVDAAIGTPPRAWPTA